MRVWFRNWWAIKRARDIDTPATYTARLLALSPLAHYSLGDAVGSSTAVDDSGNARNGTPGNITFGVTGSGDGLTAARWNGSAGTINLTTALASVWGGQEGSVVLRINTTALSDATTRRLFAARVDANNLLDLYSDGAGNITAQYTAGGTSKFTGYTPLYAAGWLDVAVTWSKTANALIIYFNGMRQDSIKTGLGTWAGTPVGVRIGSKYDNSGGFFSGDIAHVTVLNRALSVSEVVRAAERSGQVLFDGDSRSDITYEMALMADSTVEAQKWGGSIYAVSGTTTSQFISRAATGIDAAYSSDFGTRQVCVVFGGVNDGRAGVSAATIWANLQTYCTARRARGYKVLLCTEIDAQDANANANNWHSTVYPALNTLIRAGYASVADDLADLGADSRLQDATNTTYFNADKLHPNATGSAVIGAIVKPKLLGLMG